MLDNFLAIIIKIVLKKRFRGSSKISIFLSKWSIKLHEYPIDVPGGKLISDFRINSFHEIIINPMNFTSEHIVAGKFIKESEIVFDLGANAGLYSVWFAKLVGKHGRVYSFEPNFLLHSNLTKSFGMISNVTLLPIAISDFNGIADFFLPEEDQTMASLSNWTGNSPNKIIKNTCEVRTLDSLFLEGMIPTPSFIKCDIEGGELASFKGAYNLLNIVDAPIIFFEANVNTAKGFGLKSTDSIYYLQSLEKPNYSFYIVDDFGDLVDFKGDSINHANILAIPELKKLRLVQ